MSVLIVSNRFLSALVICVFLLAAANVYPEDALQNGKLFIAKTQADEIWIDVRSRKAFRAGHVEGAIHIAHGDIGHKILDAVPSLFTTVHIYDSNSGGFAGLALEILLESGYQDVINEGDYQQLVAKHAAAAAN